MLRNKYRRSKCTTEKIIRKLSLSICVLVSQRKIRRRNHPSWFLLYNTSFLGLYITMAMLCCRLKNSDNQTDLMCSVYIFALTKLTLQISYLTVSLRLQVVCMQLMTITGLSYRIFPRELNIWPRFVSQTNAG